MSESSADRIVSASANGAAISLRMSLINLTNPSKYSVFRVPYTVMLTLLRMLYKALRLLFSVYLQFTLSWQAR
jgi:hypothetical protein